MSITQTLEVPANHRLTIDVPREIPTGTTARFEVIWFPQKKTVNSLDDALDKIWELCKDAPITVDSFLQMRQEDKKLEENKYRRLFGGTETSN